MMMSLAYESSDGNVSTSVVLFFLRNRLLSAFIDSSSTSAIEMSRFSRSARSTRVVNVAISRRLSRGIATPVTSTFMDSRRGFRGGIRFVDHVVRDDDLRDERMAHDVALVEVEELDAFDVLQDVARLAQSRLFPFGQIDLCHVSRDDRFRAEAEPREEHFHLLGSRILRFVEDDERVVQRATAHEREWRDA